MSKINIRESLNRLDIKTDNKYDLRNTYDCSKISDDKKKELAEALNKNASAKEISKLLSEDYDDFDHKYDARYEVDSYYGANYSGLEDDLYTNDFEEVKDWVWEKIQKGGYIEVSDRERGKSVRLDPDSYDWESDDAYGVLDDLEELSPLNEEYEDDVDNSQYLDTNDSYRTEVSSELRSFLRSIEKGKSWDEALVNLGYKCVDPGCIGWSKETEDGEIYVSFENIDDEGTIENSKINFAMFDKNGDVVEEDSFDFRMRESLKEANYGGAYDIEDDMFFTREEINELAENVCDELQSRFGYDYETVEVGMNSTTELYLCVQDIHGIEEESTFKIDMRKIRKPSDLFKYAKPIAGRLAEKFEEEYQYYDFDESLKEDLDEEQLYKIVCKSGASEWPFESALSYEDAEKIVDYYNGRWIDERGFEWSMEIEEDDESTERAYPFDESLKEGLGEVSGDFAFARKNWDKLGTGVSFDDALEEYNDKYGEEYFYAKPIYVKSAWNKMVSMFAESLKEDYDDKKSVEFSDFWVWAKTKDGKWKLYDAASEQEDVSNSLRNAKADKRFVGTKVTKNGERPDGTKNYNVLTSESLKEAIEDEIDFDEEEYDDSDGVEEGNIFFEDGREWTWKERIAGPVHIDFDNWAVWSAYDEAEVDYFVVDEDTGFIDWGPVENQTEAQDFLNGKVSDWEKETNFRHPMHNDLFDESLKESKDIKDDGYEVTIHYDDIGNENNSEYDYKLDRDDFLKGMCVIVEDDEDAPENYDMRLEWVEDNLEKLIDKYEINILDYFLFDAQEDEYNSRENFYEPEYDPFEKD